MTTSPPTSPANGVPRPMSAMIRPNRSSSRLSMSSKQGGGSRASDEDSKTAVKVAVRVRPPLKTGEPGYDLIPQRFRGATCHVTSPSSLAVDAAGGRKVFVFDRVFGEDIDQEGVFEYVTDSINSFVQGYNVSVLAYGQSGAGKSYTMGTTGPQEQGDNDIMGIIPRAAALLFDKLEGHSNRASASGIRAPSRLSGLHTLSGKSSANKNWQLKATYVEIYNEQLRDLLLPENTPLNERSTVNIREDRDGRILLTGLTQNSINSVEDLLSALNFGSAIRQTDATAVNAKSSRSHAVFSLNLVQKKTSAVPSTNREKRRSVPIEMMSGSSESWVTVDSKLHFVDLAGSERLKNTQAQGERAKEGISINAGLASLGKVISQLSARSQGGYVSYRDSRLTRLLQDSLGGNAITYMIACVNPAEFHLSETLNTVQYAQRARAIQVKPQIQQVHDDSDKQAAIERLRAEVNFLRDQIRLSERTDRKKANPQERVERQQEREMELQNQLLDVQENYSALSTRHAKLISEITKARDNESADTPMLKDAIGDSALERLKRSNSFAEAVESVVLEYEKTIQSLESSLSITRSSLSTNESDLMEKETRIAILESQNHQLQSRIQKAIDRDANNEEYVKSLERQVDNSTNGIEKNDTTISDLRDKLKKARENESSCEEYISTLEERLAENEQEVEIMTREIDRLKHVVERQRSVGKLDNLLYELDTMRQADAKAEETLVNGHSKSDSDPFVEKRPQIERRVTGENGHQFSTTVDAIAEEPDGERPPTAGAVTGIKHGIEEQDDHSQIKAIAQKELSPDTAADEPSSPAQSRFVHDKLDSVTHELFDLRVEHEGTLQDYEKLASKYQEALRTLAALQDTVDEARHRGASSVHSSRPTSFVETAGANGLKVEDGQLPSSRTLSAELSSVEFENDNLPDDDTEAGHDQTKTRRSSIDSVAQDIPDSVLVQELNALKLLHAEKEDRMAELHQNFSELQEEHQDTLDYVEELKSEITKAQMTRPASPSVHMIRRKSSQAVLANDRSNRAFASLRNMALDTFEEDPDAIQNFELNLNTIMSELHTRSERVQELEAEVNSVRKEMEGKMTLISGLTKERSSMKAGSPLDISIVASMQDQMKQNEDHIKELKDSHTQREHELHEQIATLKASVKTPGSPDDANSPRHFQHERAASYDSSVSTDDDAGRATQLNTLSDEAAKWQSKHLEVIEATKASEKRHLDTVRDLESAKEQLEADHASRLVELERSKGAEAEIALEQERAKHAEFVAALQIQVDEHKAIAVNNAIRLAELEESHASIIKQVEEDAEARALTEKELDTHRSLVTNLEHQIEEHKAAINFHQQGMDSLQKSHAVELEKLSSELTTHQNSSTLLQADLSQAKTNMETLLKGISAVLGQETDLDKVQSHIEALVSERKSISTQMDEAIKDLQTVRQELSDATNTIGTLKGNLKEFELINAETLKELERVSEKELKSSRLVQELEDQLNQNWDQHEAANNRLSALQTERTRELQDAIVHGDGLEKEVQESRIKIALLESQLVDAKRNSTRGSIDPREDLHRSNSNNSNARKSTSHTSLPSPPPAIPLPPLPPGSPPPQANAPSPPTSRHQSKDIAHAQLVEDQEARIRTIEKHLFAEKQLTATLEDALTDLEASSTKTKTDLDQFRKKCVGLEEELNEMRKERSAARHSLQAVEEERNARLRVEAERAHLEARMAALNNANKKSKKKGTLNCF
ncbi:kinesin-domain-containing protein [Cucurbitaria berberidis CBS 394.84]|uniref:Kinesin-domain-containing protein n=1 Tax=Cucurbitaria berberidis CBS 394.84 TaxID=1168544 RepID=A0A9P4G953_9PLEO|nr:kinesin-domain-containing protein [Cucurbitaria berberidis CBS 394.84]KAF1841166.1 kinesin-domain-containing protein [Cucurbitaria berberidis CBS 394.84]